MKITYKTNVLDVNTIRYSEYKRSLIGKTVEDVIFENPNN